MKSEVRILHLRRVLIVKAAVTVFVWGLPSLLAPLSFLELLKVPIPAEPVYLRLFGGRPPPGVLPTGLPIGIRFAMWR